MFVCPLDIFGLFSYKPTFFFSRKQIFNRQNLQTHQNFDDFEMCDDFEAIRIGLGTKSSQIEIFNDNQHPILQKMIPSTQKGHADCEGPGRFGLLGHLSGGKK